MIEPVTIEEARRQCRLDDDGDDALLAGLIAAAREWVEGYTGLILARRPVTQTFDGFGPWLELHAWPIAPEPVTIAYRDAGWSEQALAAESFVVMSAARPARIVSPTNAWPQVAATRGAVSVTATAGFTPEEVPASLKAAMLLVIAGLYDSRDELPEATERAALALCGQFKRWRV